MTQGAVNTMKWKRESCRDVNSESEVKREKEKGKIGNASLVNSH